MSCDKYLFGFFFCFYFASLYCNQGFCQITTTSTGVQMMACTKRGQVLLRWSPTNPVAWQYAIKYGYELERVTIVKNGKIVPINSLQKVRWSFKVASQDAFKSAFEKTKDSLSAVALQAVYGQSFIAKSQNPNIYDAIEKTKEVEQRFVFSMYAASLSRTTAKLLGTFYVDSLIVTGEKYLYRVYIPLPNTNEKLDTGSVFVDANVLTEYPRNRSLKASFTSKQVKLNWEYNLHQGFFSSYIVERSEDGINFSPITSRPYASLVEKAGNTLMFYVDSIPVQNNRYYFRVCGRTYFGENGPYSNVVYGSCKEALPVSPKILSLIETEPQKLKVDWALPSDYNRLVRVFQIHISPSPKGKAQITIIRDVSLRSITLSAPFPSNYVSIMAIGTDSLSYGSPQRLFQLKDVTPPSTPTKYKARIDTNGVLTITWDKNKEPDIYGYRVYYANALHEEFIQPYPIIFKDTIYRDTLNLYNLTNKIFFKLSALDYHFNPSKLTPPIEVTKPDKVPPAPPVFSGVISKPEGVDLKWNASNSSDVVQHILYRREDGEQDWVTLARFDTLICPREKSCSYLNATANESEEKGNLKASKKVWYNYTIRALDRSGNYSAYAEIIRAKPLDLKVAKPISGFSVVVDRDSKSMILNWKHTESMKTLIYRGIGNSPLTHYYSVDNSQSFTDTKLNLNTSYSYRIRALLKDGSMTPFSDIIQINY